VWASSYEIKFTRRFASYRSRVTFMKHAVLPIEFDELDLRKKISEPNNIYIIHPCKSKLILFLQYKHKSLKNPASKQQLISLPFATPKIS
jgi:hypothetical protein